MKMYRAKPFKLSIANQWHEGEAMPPEAFVPPNQPYKFAVRLKNEAGQIIGSQIEIAMRARMTQAMAKFL